MEISVIIPCCNLEKYIARCLKSVISQQYDKKRFEIIVVLDSCTDNTQGIAADILRQTEIESTIVITDVKSAGYARNEGLEEAKGEFIWFVDGDDYLTDNNALWKLRENILSNGSNAVYMNAFESEDKNIINIEKDAIWRYFYRRSIIGNTKFISAPINEDWIFVRAIRRKTEYRESRINDVLYHYTHPREGSITEKYAFRQNEG